jgi:hypothetical protein
VGSGLFDIAYVVGVLRSEICKILSYILELNDALGSKTVTSKSSGCDYLREATRSSNYYLFPTTLK